MDERKQIYRCPNDCSVSDYNTRCKRCGQWMLSAGKHTDDEIAKYNEELTKSAL